MTSPLRIPYWAVLALCLAACGDRSASEGPASVFGGGEASAYASTDHEAAAEARQLFEDAASELRSAVDDLSHSSWDLQMGTIRDRLEDADDALSELESIRPDDAAVQDARNELDAMRDHLSRLHSENWRTVRPDLDSSSSAIEDSAMSIEDEEE